MGQNQANYLIARENNSRRSTVDPNVNTNFNNQAASVFRDVLHGQQPIRIARTNQSPKTNKSVTKPPILISAEYKLPILND